MARVTLYNQDGKEVGQIELDASLFDVEIQPALVHEAVIAQTANARAAVAHTKNRGEVAGTGKKPWKQKGTGRARHGSRRSPIWVGGGITFGPRNDRNFSVKLNKKARRKALAMVLSDKVQDGKLIAVEQLKAEAGKTKTLGALLKKLPISTKKTLILVEPTNRAVSTAARNLQNVTTLPINALNIVDLLKPASLVISKDGIDVLTQLYKRA
ncbi:50S ribosomal protein L4 [Candidatus Uhrbacteria bacterium]|nr:50S ribosomal protein L4 [Candidatus Uhrbacteria bacterium]